MKQHLKAFFATRKLLLALLICIPGAAAFSLYCVQASTNPYGREALPDSSFRREDYEKLQALQFDGYGDMSISQYQALVWQQTDTEAYRQLLEQFSKDSQFYETRDSNALASFFFYVLEPVTAEQWQAHSFSNSARADLWDGSGQGLLEYVYTLTILEPDTLTVRGYEDARAGIDQGLQGILLNHPQEQLQDENRMSDILREEIDGLSQKWSSSSLLVTVEYGYRTAFPETGSTATAEPAPSQEQEARIYPRGTQADYESLLQLKTGSYQEQPLADFNQALLQWADQDYQRMERVNEDLARKEFPSSLSKDDLSFVTVTVLLSGAENGAYVEHSHTGLPTEDPSYGAYLPLKTSDQNGRSSWCSLYYEFSYHVADPSVLTVGERDRCIGGIIHGIQDLWDSLEAQDLLSMDETAFAEMFREIAAEYSSSQLTVTVCEDRMYFEKSQEPMAGTADPYRLLMTCRPEDPAHTTMAGFYASLTPDPDSLNRLLDAYARLDVSPEDEAYEFLTVTLNASLMELYCEAFDEEPFFRFTLSRQERPYPYRDSEGETIYQFLLYVDTYLNYRILSPETLTIAERDMALLTFRQELTAYVDSLSQEAITDKDFRELLEKKGSALAAALSTDELQLSCEIGLIDLFAEGGA